MAKFKLTDEEEKNVRNRVDLENGNQPRGLTRWEQTMASMNERADRLQASELERTNAWHQRLADARARRIGELRDRAITDPGRFSPFQRNALLGSQHTRNGDVPLQDINERNRLRKHELDMLKQTGENEFKVAEQKRLGMKERGSDAAGFNAESTKYGWDTQKTMEAMKQKGLTEREKMIGDRTERIAGMEHGTIGPNGTVTPGSRERVATITGQSAVQQQTEANKGLAAQAEINRQKQQEQIAAQIQRSIIAAGGKADAAKIAGHAKIIGEALKNGAMTGKDPATVMAELSEQYKDDPEMLKSIQGAGGQQQAAPATGSNIEKGTRKTFPNGQTGMWDGTKWVPVS